MERCVASSARNDGVIVCHAKQYSDQIVCHKCSMAWDMNDPEPPQCPIQAGVTMAMSYRIVTNMTCEAASDFWAKMLAEMIEVDQKIQARNLADVAALKGDDLSLYKLAVFFHREARKSPADRSDIKRKVRIEAAKIGLTQESLDLAIMKYGWTR